MEERKNRAWQIMLALMLLFLLGAFICARAGLAEGSGELEMVRAEAYAAEAESPAPMENDKAATPAKELPEPVSETEPPKQVAELIAWDSSPKLLESIPLSKNTQREIFDLCGQDVSLFAAVMAIANKESRFVTNVIGDGGRCVGLMQINYAFHVDRMKSLGVTNLLDPVQNAAVGISYIMELEKEFSVGHDCHVLYVAYNMGPTGARELFGNGMYSNSYSWEVADYYDAYMRELSAG